MKSLEDLLARIKQSARRIVFSVASVPLLAMGWEAASYATYEPRNQPYEEPIAPYERTRQENPETPDRQASASDEYLVRRGENLWSIVKRHYALTDERTIREKTRAVCDANIQADTPASERYRRDTRRFVNDEASGTPIIERASDGIACDELEPGDALHLPRYEQAAQSPISEQEQSRSPATLTTPASDEPPSGIPTSILVFGLAAAGVSAYVATRKRSRPKKTPLQALQGTASSGSSIDDAITLYLGNYAHGDKRDTSVKDIIKETNVSASRLYRTLKERDLPTRKELAARARAYVAEKLSAVRARGESVSAAGSHYGVSSSTANRLVQRYTH